MRDTVVVVPAYDEAGAIASVVRDLLTHFDHVVCVDDGSADDTAGVARAAGAVVLRHVLNRGQGAALQTGFDYVLRSATARHVVTFDADGQHLAADAVAMVRHAQDSGVDVVLASRFLGTAPCIPAVRRVLLHAAVWFTRRTTGLALTDTHNGLRVLSVDALRRVRLTQPGMAHASELQAQVARAGLTWVELPTTVLYTEYSRAKGQGHSNAVNILFDLALRRIGAVS